MKKLLKEFCRRGLIACGFGPLILAAIYLILRHCGVLQTLTVEEVCMGIFSLSGLAFIVGGMNMLYSAERLPLMWAILIHGAVLYLCYLATYLLNGWLAAGSTPLLIFSAVFVFGYLTIWVIIYAITKSSTDKLNEKLRQKHSLGGDTGPQP